MTTLQEIARQIDAILGDDTREIASAQSTAALEEIRLRVLGKKGRLSLLMRTMKDVPSDERPAAGKVANEAKEAVLRAIEERRAQLREQEIAHAVRTEGVDVTMPGIRPRLGALHPITRVRRRIEDIFLAMGFRIELGPDIEDEHHNFDALNFPPEHPARDMHDTLYLATDLLLRTHTSPVQIHTMKKYAPPLAVIAPGKCYRSDAADATHSPMFHQVEGFMVDTNIRFSDLKGVLGEFVHSMFGYDTPYRLRPSFFPFTEPSAEVDILFRRRRADGQVVEKWLEILGSGMIHPNVLRNCDIDPEKYTGFAFGMGIERIAMLRYGINSMYSFFENDVRFLAQFV
ncbi:phenylalanine--tRNA ligase subunit alpha [Candidatus Sumerlaeota bacterium]|nr:phenylalanine--tRNA ligase subunit alpha [Candidatus Sumerlaeota bacterium]